MLFTNIIKPTHICNLDCKYCYNDDVRDPVMTDTTLERVIDQTFAYTKAKLPSRKVDFIWHGGEPMVPGVKFYEKVVALQAEAQARHGTNGYTNLIQTNGVLMKQDWIEFFKCHNFWISMSIDGPKMLHDQYRVDKRGRGSYERVMRAIELVKAADIPLGLSVVLNKSNVGHVEEMFRFLSDHQLGFNIIPMNKSGGARGLYSQLGLDAEEYGEAWIKMYDKWFDSDEDYVYCMDFTLLTRAILAGRPADCIGLAQCGQTNVSIDPVGDVFACASLSGHDDIKYGNVNEADMVDIMQSVVASSFRNRNTDPQCAECKWQHVCHGGCQARAYKFHGDHNQRDYYCPSLFAMYEHVERRLLEKGLSAGIPHEKHGLN